MKITWVCPVCCWSTWVINEHVYYVGHKCNPRIPKVKDCVPENVAVKKNYCGLGE